MKKFLVLALLLVSGFLFWRMLDQKNENILDLDSAAVRSQASRSVKLSVLAAEPLELDLPLKELRGLSCEIEQRAFMDHSVDQLLDQVRQGRFPPQAPDSAASVQEACFPEVDGRRIEVCLKMREHPGDQKLMASCHSYLTFARALQIAARTADWDHFDSMDLGVLVNQILAKVLRSPSLSRTEREQWRQMTEALMDRQPESLEALKAHLMTYVSDPAIKSFDLDGEMSAWLDKGLEMSPSDPHLIELQLFIDAQQGDGRIRLQNYLEREPSAAIGHYYLASQEWRAENRKATIRALRRAIELDPSQRRFRDSLNKARNPRTSFGESIFVLQLGAAFDQI